VRLKVGPRRSGLRAGRNGVRGKQQCDRSVPSTVARRRCRGDRRVLRASVALLALIGSAASAEFLAAARRRADDGSTSYALCTQFCAGMRLLRIAAGSPPTAPAVAVPSTHPRRAMIRTTAEPAVRRQPGVVPTRRESIKSHVRNIAALCSSPARVRVFRSCARIGGTVR